jgi:hypothetical protein
MRTLLVTALLVCSVSGAAVAQEHACGWIWWFTNQKTTRWMPVNGFPTYAACDKATMAAFERDRNKPDDQRATHACFPSDFNPNQQ